MKFTLNMQLFASKKGVSSTKNGRDSAGIEFSCRAKARRGSEADIVRRASAQALSHSE